MEEDDIYDSYEDEASDMSEPDENYALDSYEEEEPETSDVTNRIRKTSMFVNKHGNEWIAEAIQRPDPKSLWHSLWHEGEVCCLFADTNVGKSIYAVQIADEIGKEQPVLYFDFEMSDKQFQLRYTDPATNETYSFSKGFGRLEFSKDSQVLSDIDTIIEHIEAECVNYNAKVVIIDNITWLCNRSECGDAAGVLMQLLISLKKRLGLSIMVLAHTPKRCIYSALTQNSLAGSKRIANFMDSMFAIGLSKANRPQGRYIKQIKVRSCEMLYGETNVIVAELVKEGSLLQLRHTGFAAEADVMAEPDAEDEQRKESLAEIRRLLAEKKSYSEIAGELGMSKAAVGRWALKIKNAG